MIFSVGTPPVRSSHIEFISQVQLGGQVRDLRKYRDVIGVTGDLNEAHWNYLMDTLEQMIGQSTHYTTGAEKADFLNRMRWAVNFKGLNGMITTVVSGNADKAVSLLRGEVFGKNSVQVLENRFYRRIVRTDEGGYNLGLCGESPAYAGESFLR